MIHLTRNRGWLIFGCLILCLAAPALGLDPSKTLSQYAHDRWDPARGFVGGAVYAICQSADGYLWIGTEQGLVRFDGFHFTLLPRPIPNAAPLGPVRGLVSDAEGNLWIRLDGTRLVRYRDGRFEDASVQFDLGEISFTAMSPDNEGGLLLSGLGSRTLRYDGGTIVTIADSTEMAGTVISLGRTRDQRVWIGTRDDGLFRVDGGRVVHVSMDFANLKINALTPAKDGGIWIGTDRGIKYLDRSGILVRRVPASFDHLQIFSMVLDHDANLWAGTDQGLLRINRNGVASIDQWNKALDQEATAVYEDRDGDLWVGDSQGLERLRDGTFTTYSTADGLPPKNNGPIYTDSDGRTWFAPVSGGLYWLKDGHVSHVSIAGLDNDVIYSISGGGGEIWVGRQRGGITVLRKSGEPFATRTYSVTDGLAQNSVFAVHRDRDGSVWAGTLSAGVSRLKNGVFRSYSTDDGLPSNAINSIVEASDGTIWLATPSGLCSFANGHWLTRNTQDGLPSVDIRSIFEDSNHVLWIATSNGLAFLASGRIGVPHFLPESLREQIFGITEDGLGHLWFATSDHVIQVSRDQLLHGPMTESDVQSFGTEDGLDWIEGVRRDRSLVADSLGRVWISLNHGLAEADPKLTQSSAIPVSVRMESMASDGLEIKLGDSPKVPAGNHSITFTFAGTCLSAPERIRFRYKLEGADQGWSDPVDLKQVIYSNLGPGTYRFHVVASNNLGLWNGPETSVSFLIDRTFWQTLWFRVSCLMAFVLMTLAFYRLRMHQLAHRMDTLFQERLGERTRIAQELHDTLLQSFQGLMFRFQTVEEMLPNRPADAREALGAALNLADQALMESRDAIKDIRSSPSANRDLAKALNALMAEVGEEVNASNRDAPEFSVIVVGRPQSVGPVLRAEILRIAREAIRNSFRHAHAGRIETEIAYEEPLFRLRFRDDGRGIDPGVLERGKRAGHWGLVGMEERAKRVGGQLDVWSKVGAGTEVELRIPGQIAYEALPTRTFFQIFRRKAKQNHDE
jgi:ligand-binding sensor domain-containing protein/signal transduction histidine kinase